MAIAREVERPWFIYKITNPYRQVYIGRTCNFSLRKNGHRSQHKKGKFGPESRLGASFKKWGFDNHSFEAIDSFVGNEFQANSKEMFWIRTYMSNFTKWPEISGLNLTNGGSSVKGIKLGPQSRANMSNGRPKDRPWESIQKCVLAMKKAKSKKIIEIDLDSVEIEEFESVTQAAKKVGCSDSAIRYVCIGKYKNIKGRMFKYK